ncbi:MAG TPA: hypothetical protein VMZ24_05250 [Patescibacteria group bacterium]|jgi:hypothetical protein|nr:hypothetical protein [Patescibacteria group bacterium]
MTEFRSRLSGNLPQVGWRHLAYLLVALALLVFVGYFIAYNIYAISLFQFPFDYDQGEGFELMDTVLFSRGEWPYLNNDSYPFYSSNYPPVFHLVIVPLIWIFGPKYWTGRLVAYLGTLITAAVIGYAVQRESKRWWLSTLAGLAFLASNYVYHVGPLFRQHMFMVMFETVAVVLLTATINAEETTGKKDNRRLLLVMILLLLAGYTKQLAYATVAAVFTFLFLRQSKRAILWAIAFAGVTGIIFLLINLSTNGQWLTNTVTANINPYIPSQGIGLLRQWFKLHTILILLASALALYQLYFERLSAYAIWFVFAAANGLTSGKWGAGESYFATAIAASCILAGIAIGRGLSWSERRGERWFAIALTVVAMLFLIQANKVFHWPTHTPLLEKVATTLGKPKETFVAPQTSCSLPREVVAIPYIDSAGVGLIGRPPNAEDTAAGVTISQLISEGDSASFGEDAGFNFYLGRDIITNPTQLLNLYNNGQVDLTEMSAMLENQEFDTVVLRAQFYPPPILEIIGRQYLTRHLVEMNGFVYCILTPKDLGE